MRRKVFIVLILLFLLMLSVSVWVLVTPVQALPEFLQQFKIDNATLSTKSDTEYNPQMTTIIYHTADFSENIYDDATYLDLLGPYVMYYKSEDVEYSLQKSDVDRYGVWAEFFYDYFETIKNGDNVTYNSYFFDDYYNTHTQKNEFTMQKIYDIRVEELNVSVNLDNDEYSWVYQKGIEPVCFNVKYKIRHNNGTFRLGVASDTYQSQLYILATDKNDKIKIIDIVEYSAD